ncbi:hypothetical protein J5O04_07635 [Corynebacterium hindlerae]|uniref:hypothetical protein n=1 Tax=Corynebacterium hindlerae TaxID=699041 RepID=UPI001AD73439|nr:hypothetical protein [Corynebacterium hindlerae]QTH58716.1 hypothetical protein J5O04_07635 [Corynebacterium hindlerae]
MTVEIRTDTSWIVDRGYGVWKNLMANLPGECALLNLREKQVVAADGSDFIELMKGRVHGSDSNENEEKVWPSKSALCNGVN